MPNGNARFSDQFKLMGAIDPDANAAGTFTTGWVSMADFDGVYVVVSAGTLGTSATIDAKLQQATDSSGTGVKDVTSSSITQLTDAGSDSDKQAIIECRGENLDVANGFDHVRLSVTVATATSDSAGYIFGCNPRYSGVADASTVDEIVVV